RLVALIDEAAVAITKARLWLWNYIPSSLRPWACRFLGTRYSPGSQANRIFVLRHSNYSERLRWVLELSGEEFHEVPVAIFFERSTAMYHSLGAGEVLPVISTSGGRGGFKTIPRLMEHLSKERWRTWMYPVGAHELESKFEQAFGQAAMNVACTYLFQQEMYHETMEMLSRSLPLWQKLVVQTLGAGVVSTTNERLRLTETLSANVKIIERTFGLVESILSDGRLYLCGDSISAADIAFASMAFPVILPEETDSVFVAYDPRSLPRGYVEVIKSMRSRGGGIFILRLYNQKRIRKGGVATRTLARSPRRGRSFTLRKNVNSPSQTITSQQGGRRATLVQVTPTAPLIPLSPGRHRASIAM
ncbi:unnamed protein product, partial [Pylaiella littoralis]